MKVFTLKWIREYTIVRLRDDTRPFNMSIPRTLQAILFVLTVGAVVSFRGRHHNKLVMTLRPSMSIRWQFEDVGDPAAMLGGGEMGGRENAPKSLKDLGIIGAEGELYFNPSKRASLDLPSDYLQPIPGLLPIFPHDGIICPGSAEWLTATDMRLRQMFQENKRFGVLHHSPTNQRVALTGTIVKIKERQFSPDGRIFVSVEGLERFYVREFVDENPYLLARATIFRDFADFRSTIDRLEYNVANRVRINMHMIQWLFPNRIFSMNAKVADNFPPPLDYVRNNTRTFAYIPDETLLQRRSEFLFGVINMLQITPAAKLALMQEPILENRMTRVHHLLKMASQYLEKELLKKKLRTRNQIEDMKQLTQLVMDDAIRSRYLDDLDKGSAVMSTTGAEGESRNPPALNPAVPSHRWVQRIVRM